MTAKLRVLSIAAASSRVGYVLLERRRIATRGLSRKASTGQDAAAECAANWIEQLRPDIVVTEHLLKRSKKGAQTRAVITAIAAVADTADVQHIEIVRGHSYANKFEEAAALAADYPELGNLLPKVRRPWDNEPKATVYFEALSLALTALGSEDKPMLAA